MLVKKKGHGPELEMTSTIRIKNISLLSNAISSSSSSSYDPFNDNACQNFDNSDCNIKNEECAWKLENNNQEQGKQLVKVSEQSLYKD